MTFAHSSGPPASAKQMRYLESLLQQAGYTSFRDARRPLGLTARQARAKFTVGEASELIDRLVNAEPAPAGGEATASDTAAAATPADADADADAAWDDVLRGIPADALAAELARRGWQVSPPA